MQPDLSRYHYFVTYTPFPTEPDPHLILPSPKDAFVILQGRTLDPQAVATEAMRAAAGRPGCIFIPGTRFDVLGTRHGRGGGWYDRFLAAIPVEWLRVGICTESQWSSTPLQRESWDEPVDCVAIVRTDGATWFETKARANASKEYP